MTTATMLTYEAAGQVAGQDVGLITLQNAQGLRAVVTNYGATLTQLHVPDRFGQLGDVVLGFERVQDYVAGSPYFGCTAGRVANRIALGRFELAGQAYQLATNDAPHHLHGGPQGWDKRVWRVLPSTPAADVAPEVVLEYVSPAGEEGYPGNMTARVRYALSENSLIVDMSAQCDAVSLVNLAHHSYWNLAGHSAGELASGELASGELGSIVEHELRLCADEYTPGDPVVPSGSVEPVLGSAFDFTQPKAIGRDIDQVGPVPAGYDHNFVVRGAAHEQRLVAELYHAASGRCLRLSANQPGVQLYSGNFLDGSLRGKGGVKYGHRSGVCLETQAFPNAVNVPAWRGQVVLEPGQTYRHVMQHEFVLR